jgi:23S rRNA (adenine2503-C2)-methyltransferase
MSTDSTDPADGSPSSPAAKESTESDSDKRNLFGLTLEELERFAVNIGEKAFRGRQLFQWIYQKRCTDFDPMSNLNRPLRERLSELADIRLPQIIEEQKDPEDGTRKFLVQLLDHELIEMVLIPVGERLALCMSSQVGCPIGCRFCATGLIGFRRNLTAGEMLAQLMLAQDQAGDSGVSTVVLMGMGEPLLNLDNVVAMIKTAASEKGLGFGARRFTISTVGLVTGIRKLTAMRLKSGLALSLHAPLQALREELIPLAGANPLEQLIPACREYAEQAGDRVTLEYLLIAGLTDTMECARALAALSNQLPCKINLIAYNPIDYQLAHPVTAHGASEQPVPGSPPGLPGKAAGADDCRPQDENVRGVPPGLSRAESRAAPRIDPTTFRPPSTEAILRFRDYLYPRCPAVTFRQPKGLNIAAACGQLAGRKRSSPR